MDWDQNTFQQNSTASDMEKSGAYGAKAADTDFRKKWDKEEYAERAQKKDQEERERMQENEERLKQGQFNTCYAYISSSTSLQGSVLARGRKLIYPSPPS